MSVKIAVTVTDFGAAVHIGGPAEAKTSVIELNDSQVPELLRKFLEGKQRDRDAVAAGRRGQHYATLSFSLLEE